MVTESYAEARYSQQRRGNSEMEPINAEVPQVARHCGQGKNKGADQERACRPIDAVGRNSESQGKGEIVRSMREEPASQSLLKGATENHVFLGPGMNAAAMRAIELLRFHFGRWPELLFYC